MVPFTGDHPFMIYVTRPGRENDPRIRAMARRNGDDPDKTVWGSRVVNEWSHVILDRNPGKPWKGMQELYGKHEGETILICGSGESLKRCPEKPGVTTMAINRSIQHVKADYWTVHDPDSWDQSKDHPNAKAAQLVGITQIYQFVDDRPLYLVDGAGKPTQWRNPDKRPLYNNFLSLTWVTHLALRMGAKRIIFIGVCIGNGLQWDGFVQPDHTKEWAVAQHTSCAMKTMQMFTLDKAEWMCDAKGVEFFDASTREEGAYLPIPPIDINEVCK